MEERQEAASAVLKKIEEIGAGDCPEPFRAAWRNYVVSTAEMRLYTEKTNADPDSYTEEEFERLRAAKTSASVGLLTIAKDYGANIGARSESWLESQVGSGEQP